MEQTDTSIPTTVEENPPRPFQVMPPLPPDEQEALENSIREVGVLAPIIVDENGNIIDGYHRAEIAERLGKPIRKLGRKFADDAARRTAAYELNTARRTLTQEQKRQLVAQSIASDPELSDRQHARRCGVSHPTVATVRKGLEHSGDVVNLSTRTDSKGRQQPASKPPTAEADKDDLADEEAAEETAPGGLTDEPTTTGGDDAKQSASRDPSPQRQHDYPLERRRPITEAFAEASTNLRASARTLQGLTADDRFVRNAQAIANQNKSTLRDCIDTLDEIYHDRLPEPEGP